MDHAKHLAQSHLKHCWCFRSEIQVAHWFSDWLTLQLLKVGGAKQPPDTERTWDTGKQGNPFKRRDFTRSLTLWRSWRLNYLLRGLKRCETHRAGSSSSWRSNIYQEHMLRVCGRWRGPGPAAHGDFCLGRLLGVDGLHRLLLKHWPVTCGFICTQQAAQSSVNKQQQQVASSHVALFQKIRLALLR